MTLADLRFLYAYDRWATRKVLAAAGRLRKRDWPGRTTIDTRNLGEILVHALGAHQRWRHGLSGESGRGPRPEREPMPPVAALVAAWDTEWAELDTWFERVDDAALAREEEDVPYWQMLAHVVNHGTQHRSEAAVLLTAAGKSPKDLDMFSFSEKMAKERGA